LVASSFFMQLGHIAGPRSGILTLHLVHFFIMGLPSLVLYVVFHRLFLRYQCDIQYSTWFLLH